MYEELVKEFGEPNSVVVITSTDDGWASWENDLYILTVNKNTGRITILSMALDMLCYNGKPKTIKLLKQIINSIL